MVLCYAIYLAVVAANVYFAALWSAKTSGTQRLLGVIQTTGFAVLRRALTGRLISEGGFSLTMYLLALAVPALVVVLRYGTRLQRSIGLLYCAAAAVLGYTVTLGTLEKQELYFLVISNLLIIEIAGTRPGQPGNRQWFNRHWQAARGTYRNRRTALGTSAMAFLLSVNVVTCLQWLRQPDDGFALLLAYLGAHVPMGMTVTVAPRIPATKSSRRRALRPRGLLLQSRSGPSPRPPRYPRFPSAAALMATSLYTNCRGKPSYRLFTQWPKHSAEPQD